jgi:surface protein
MKKIYCIIILYLFAANINAQSILAASESNSGTKNELNQKNTQLKSATVPFITTWKTDNPGSSDDNQITIPANTGTLEDYTYNFTVDWGDGSTDSNVTNSITHTYATAGTYVVTIEGIYPHFKSFTELDPLKLIELNQWGTQAWLNLESAFSDCENMVYLATDIPDLSNVTDMSLTFANVSSFNETIGEWDVSNIKTFNSTFFGSTFNIDISNWNVSGAEQFNDTFSDSNFNQNISNWNVSGVIAMNSMFRASDFNQPIGNWNVSNVTEMQGMFRDSDFNQDISGWDVSNVTNMGQMFEASEFSYDIGNWNTASLQLMGGIFYDASNFDYDIGSWDISQVTDLAYSLSLSGLSVANYDKTLKGWAAQTVQPDQDFNGGGLVYCSADLERDILIDQGWVFDGDDSDCTPLLAYDFNDGDLVNNIGEFLEPTNFGASPSFDRFGNDEQAYAFDGIDDYMSIEGSESVSSIKQTLSFSAWIRPEDFELNYYTLFTNYDGLNGFYIYYEKQSNGTYRLYIYVLEQGKNYGLLTVDDAVEMDKWSHIAITADQDNGISYYKDNSLYAQNSAPFNASASSSPLSYSLGYSQYYQGEFFPGSIDQVRFYDYELDNENIGFLYYENGGPNYVWAQYDFDGDYLDKSGFIGNDPVGTNTPEFAADRFMRPDSALSLNQLAGEYLEYGWSFGDNQPFSISAWVNWKGGNNDFQNIVSWYDDLSGARTYFGVNNLGQLRFGDPYGDTGIDMPQNQWTHLVATYDGNVSKIYLNNELAGTSGEGKSYTFGSFWVGTLIDGLELWNGLIDDLKIYPRAITPYNVNDLFKENGFGLKPQSGPSNAQLYEAEDDRILLSFDRADQTVDGYIAVRSSNGFVSQEVLVDGTEYSNFEYLNAEDAYIINTINYDTLITDFNPNEVLVPNTTYYYRIWAYNGDGVSRKYSTGFTTTLEATTVDADPTEQASKLSKTASTSNSLSGSFIPSSDSNVEGYMVIYAPINGNTNPTLNNFFNRSNYTVGQVFGDYTVGYDGTSSEFTINGLSSETRYAVYLLTYTGNASSRNYNGSQVRYDFFTLEEDVSSNVSSATVDNVGENNISISWEDVLNANNQTTNGTYVFEKGDRSFIDFVNFGNTFPNNDLSIGPNSNNNRIIIRFGNGVSQKAHRFLVPANATFGVADANYSYTDYVNVPFQVWDVDRGVQLNIAFRDQDRNGTFNLLPYNVADADASLQSREYVYISDTEYNANNPNSNLAINGGHIYNNMYYFWPTLAEGATWNVGSIPETQLSIQNVFFDQKNYAVFRSEVETLNQVPTDGEKYIIGETIGNSELVFFGASNSFTESELNSETSYFYHIITVAGDGPFTNYSTGNYFTLATSTLAVEPANQPTSINFQDVSFNNLKVLFSTNGADGYLVIGRNGEAVDFVPEDGVTYELDDFVGSNTDQVILGNSGVTNISHINLTSGDTYHYAIYAFNGSGTTINYNIESPLRGQTTTLEDNTLPVLGTVTFDDEVVLGESNTVSLTVVDAESGLNAVRIIYTTPDRGDYSSANANDMSASGDQYSFTLPDISNKGMEFKIEATNGLGNTITTEAYNVRTIFTGSGLSIPFNSFGSSQSNYRIVSIPLLLDDNTVGNVFGNAFGPYDNTKWRMFRYQNGANSELSGTSSLIPGNGYWLLASEQASLNTGTGTSVEASSEEFYEIVLKSGWNQIGNPYPYDVSWSTVQTFNDISFPLRGYNGNWVDINTLATFSGGFVNNTSGGDIEIKIPTGDFATSSARELGQSEGWTLPVKLQSGNYFYALGGVGMRQDANNLADKYDQYSLPRLEEYLELNHSRQLADYSESMSIVKTQSQFEWTFNVDNNLSAAIVNMDWDADLIADLPLDLYLWDVDAERAIDMKSENAYSYSNIANKAFKIFYGDASYIKEKTKVNHLVFYSMYPNPTKDKVNLEFYVPESSKNMPIEIQIFNMKGQLFKSLSIDSVNEGLNLLNVPLYKGSTELTHGLHFIKVSQGDQSFINKLIIEE